VEPLAPPPASGTGASRADQGVRPTTARLQWRRATRRAVADRSIRPWAHEPLQSRDRKGAVLAAAAQWAFVTVTSPNFFNASPILPASPTTTIAAWPGDIYFLAAASNRSGSTDRTRVV
jgi:hypothetical protein